RQRAVRVAVDHLDEGAERIDVELLRRDVVREKRTETVERAFELTEEVTDLGVFGGETLRGVGEEELVRFFDGVGARGQRLARARRRIARAWPAGFAADEGPLPTRHRDGSWCSRYCRLVIQPKIIDLVIHHFSGRTAK